MNLKKEINNVLSIQGNSILAARRFIDGSFYNAIELMYMCKGKIVVTGIGKSGLISQKIAATLSSTGTPAIYLHPSEGMHGNLGMLSKNDVVFAIGKSGESEELNAILPSIKKIGVKIISLTSTRFSTLSKKSDVALCIPIEKEACPLNLAPTTSSTIALVVGDAIAIVLMKKRGFNEKDFALFHPGGLLGKRLLLKVSDVMRKGHQNPVVKINSTMDRLLIEISKKWTGAASVVDKAGKMVGLVTDYDIRTAFAAGKSIFSLKIIDVMNQNPITIYSDELAVNALKIMESRKKPLTIIPVIDRKKKSVGMIHLHDLVSKGLVSPQAKLS
ncbi:MAG: SIS domain-containing protein [Elusimicrobiota bacterium]